ncbi:MAG: metallopeptidase TldD-related protein [Proteobacteria bacterium]|nr:metallopeptidase TldD-related protein [Pseudomonadota bacterium]
MSVTAPKLDELLTQAEQVVERARGRGADVAEAFVRQGAHLTAKVRLGQAELVEEASFRAIGLRVMRGQQVAVTSTSDLTPHGIKRFVEDAVELAQLSQPDPFAGPPDPAQLSRAEQHADVDAFDGSVDDLDAKRALELATASEKAALATDPRLSNSDGASVTRISSASALVTSGGFRGASRGTYASLVVSPVAQDEDGKKRSGHYWSARRHLADLEDPEEVGVEAGRRTIAKLGARKIATQEVPVIFDPETGRSIIGLLAGCVQGGAIWRRASYLVERLGTRVASELVRIVDDPLIARGPGSRAFDGEGLLSRRNVVVDQGELKTFLLDSYGARKLEATSTASAARGSAGGVGVATSNFVLQPGVPSPEQLQERSERALLVTELMGFGFHAVTGDFSRGAGGFWIENGERAFPVSEVTISLNLDELLQRIDAIANDLDLRTSTACPTFRVSSMTVAGK